MNDHIVCRGDGSWFCTADDFRERIEALDARIIEAGRLLRSAYAGAHSEDVPVDVLTWLNPGPTGES